MQGAKKVNFTACHSGKLKLTFTSPNIISTSPKNVLMSRLISQFLCDLDSSKNFTCPSGKLITEFSSLIAKPTSPRLLETTFFARCYVQNFGVTNKEHYRMLWYFLQWSILYHVAVYLDSIQWVLISATINEPCPKYTCLVIERRLPSSTFL